MKTELTYSAAFSKLEELVEQLEEGDIQLDKLTVKVKEANELIRICEEKLRNIDKEIKDATVTSNIKTNKKKSK